MSDSPSPLQKPLRYRRPFLLWAGQQQQRGLASGLGSGSRPPCLGGGLLCPPEGPEPCRHVRLSLDRRLCSIGAQRRVSFESCLKKMIKGSEGLIYKERLKKLNPCSLAEP